MVYVQVAVDAPTGRSTYSYSVPPDMVLETGQLVWVPFGTRTVRGIVTSLSSQPGYECTRFVRSVSHGIQLTPLQLEIGQWVAEHYLSPLFPALALFLPPAVERQPETYLYPAESGSDGPANLPEAQARVLELVRSRGRVPMADVDRFVGKTRAPQMVDLLIQNGLVVREDVTRDRRVRPRVSTFVSPTRVAREASVGLSELISSRAPRQFQVLKRLLSSNGPVPLSDLRESCGASRAVVRALEQKGLVEIYERRVWRSPLDGTPAASEETPSLTSWQDHAWAAIVEGMRSNAHCEYLLFGVTGSGKTELYLRAAQEAVRSGGSAICLVPEIALTSQTVERFMSRFPGRVALLHSGLSPGEQMDEWERVNRGEVDVIVGARSALFSPVGNCGVIVLDEEHEWTYKQDDISPRYHARVVAREMARQLGVPLVLGSATPDVETFSRALTGETRLLELPQRIGDIGLPPLELVDMRNELRAGNISIFSRQLLSVIRETLERGEQVLLFLNRRGTATLVQCRRCGYVFECPRCSVALAYHAARARLVCHRCGYSSRLPQRCPQCHGSRIRYLGVGTQKVVDEARWMFPGARVVRWDSDIPARTRGQSGLHDAVRAGEVDIIVGTQMVTKGLDFPDVTLVGAISADLGLSLPDYRAGERTFQLLCQVAGRAGRGLKPGRVVAQTYNPDNYVIRAAADQDYRTFYQDEIRYRQEAFYPPFCSVVRLVYSNTNEERARAEAERVAAELTRMAGGGVRVTGPVPAFMHRLRGRYRWQVLVRGEDPRSIVGGMALPRGWIVDVDPVGVA